MWWFLKRRQGEAQREAERWWQEQVKEIVAESTEISEIVFHEYQATESTEFESPIQQGRVLPPTAVVRPRHVL
jgi:hypothetical protein